MRITATRPRRRRGVTILELMISLVVLTGVIVSIASFFPFTYRLNSATLSQNKAANLAAGVLEEIRGLPFADQGFLGGGASTVLSVCSFSGLNQTAWGSGNATHSNTPNANTFSLPSGVQVIFPTTGVTVVQSLSDLLATSSAQPPFIAGFGLPAAPIQVNGTTIPIGITVDPANQDIVTGAIPATSLTTAVWSATVSVTVAYLETRNNSTHPHFITVTSIISQNTQN